MQRAHRPFPCPPQLSFFQGTLELIEECCKQIPQRFFRKMRSKRKAWKQLRLQPLWWFSLSKCLKNTWPALVLCWSEENRNGEGVVPSTPWGTHSLGREEELIRCFLKLSRDPVHQNYLGAFQKFRSQRSTLGTFLFIGSQVESGTPWDEKPSR